METASRRAGSGEAGGGEVVNPPVAPPGPELDAEVWTLLGHSCPLNPPRNSAEAISHVGWKWTVHVHPRACFKWDPTPISTDPGAAFRALEIWRGQKTGRDWVSRSPVRLWFSFSCRLRDSEITAMCSSVEATTFPHAVALALQAALGGGK